MKNISVQKIAGVLNVLVLVALVCNVAALYLVPTAVALGDSGIPSGFRVYIGNLVFASEDDIVMTAFAGSALVWVIGWAQFSVYQIVLTLFLLVSGCCTAAILWQARRVLRTILKGEPFSAENAVSLKWAAIFCFVIAGAALARVIFSIFYYQSPMPLTTYNALFVPMFAMGGLLCLVMSALFRQAAEIKAENDLTI